MNSKNAQPQDAAGSVRLQKKILLTGNLLNYYPPKVAVYP